MKRPSARIRLFFAVFALGLLVGGITLSRTLDAQQSVSADSPAKNCPTLKNNYEQQRLDTLRKAFEVQTDVGTYTSEKAAGFTPPDSVGGIVPPEIRQQLSDEYKRELQKNLRNRILSARESMKSLQGAFNTATKASCFSPASSYTREVSRMKHVATIYNDIADVYVRDVEEQDPDLLTAFRYTFSLASAPSQTTPLPPPAAPPTDSSSQAKGTLVVRDTDGQTVSDFNVTLEADGSNVFVVGTTDSRGIASVLLFSQRMTYTLSSDTTYTTTTGELWSCTTGPRFTFVPDVGFATAQAKQDCGDLTTSVKGSQISLTIPNKQTQAPPTEEAPPVPDDQPPTEEAPPVQADGVIMVRDTTGQAVPGVRVSVYAEDNTAMLDQQLTGSDGMVRFSGTIGTTYYGSAFTATIINCPTYSFTLKAGGGVTGLTTVEDTNPRNCSGAALQNSRLIFTVQTTPSAEEAQIEPPAEIDGAKKAAAEKATPTPEPDAKPIVLTDGICPMNQEGILPLPDFGDADCQTFAAVKQFLQALGKSAIQWVFAIALIFLMITGYLYITSMGNKQQAETAKNSFLFIVIGILVVLSAYLIVNTLSSYVLK